MPWIFLQSDGEPVPTEPVAPAFVAPQAEPSRTERTWVLLGDLSAALFQAGYIGELLARGSVPTRIIGAGFGAVNAVLASSQREDLFRRGWERLRSRHFIMSAALQAQGGILSRFVPQDGMAIAAKHAATFVESKAEVMLVSGERFVACDKMEGSRTIDLIGPAIARTDVEPDTVAAAIDAAGAFGGSVVVWGPDSWTASSPLVHKALEGIAAQTDAVEFVADDDCPPAALIELLLPGSGVIERTMARGARAASKWRAPGSPSHDYE